MDDQVKQSIPKKSKYATVCSTDLSKRSSLITDISTVDRTELRLKLRPSVDVPTPWKWSTEIKNVRPSTMSGKLYNYRYGTPNSPKPKEKVGFDKHRRFKSVPEIKPLVSVDDFKVRSFPRKLSTSARGHEDEMHHQLRRASCGPSCYRPNSNRPKGDSPRSDSSCESPINRLTLSDSVKEFLEKPNPKQPPKSLRIHTKQGLAEESSQINRYSDNDSDKNSNKDVINTDTAPPLTAFKGRPWYYHEKRGCRYLRVKDPSPPPSDEESVLSD